MPTVSSLEDIEACLRQLTWIMDGPLHLFDCISYPQVTWAKKKDDCDGFSVIAAELLNQWSSDSNPVLLTVMVQPIRYSHTVCAFNNTEGRLSFFDNSSLRFENYQTYGDVAMKVGENTERLICWDVRNPTTLDMLEFHML